MRMKRMRNLYYDINPSCYLYSKSCLESYSKIGEI